MRTGRAMLLAGLVACLPVRSALAQEADALAIYQEAVELAKDGQYEKAIELFKKARELGAPSVALYNIARCHESLEEYELAAEYYRRYIDQPDVPGDEIPDIEATIADLESMPSLVNLSSDPSGVVVNELIGEGATLKVGTTPVEFTAEAGSHVYLLEKEGFEDGRLEIETGYGKPLELSYEMTPVEGGGGGGGGGGGEDRSPLGIYVELGGGMGMLLHGEGPVEPGGGLTLGLGWRFAHGTSWGFALGLRTDFQFFSIDGEEAGDEMETPFFLATVLAVPAYQIRLHERVGLELTLPVGVAILDAREKVDRDVEIPLIGGYPAGGGLALFDIGFGASLRIRVVSGLYVVVEPLRVHVLVPTAKGWQGAKALADMEFIVRLGFEI